jgi:hypothetical protein
MVLLIATAFGFFEVGIYVNGHYEYNLELFKRFIALPTLVGVTLGNVVGFIIALVRYRINRRRGWE